MWDVKWQVKNCSPAPSLLSRAFLAQKWLSLFSLDKAFVPCLTCLSGVEVASFSLALRPVRLHPPTTRVGGLKHRNSRIYCNVRDEGPKNNIAFQSVTQERG